MSRTELRRSLGISRTARFHRVLKNSSGVVIELIDEHPGKSSPGYVNFNDRYPAYERGNVIDHYHGLTDGTHGCPLIAGADRLRDGRNWMD